MLMLQQLYFHRAVTCQLGELESSVDSQTQDRLSGCTAFSVHPSIFYTHFLSSGSAYPSMRWLKGRETPWTGQQSITGLTRIFTFTFKPTPTGNSKFPVHLSKLQHPEDANTRYMNTNAVRHFKQQQRCIFHSQVVSRLPSAHAFFCIM